MTGLGVLWRSYWRRDRWLVFWFVVGTALLYWSQAPSVDNLYPDQESFDRAAELMGSNAAFVAMAGPARALNTVGGQVAWQATAFGAIVVGLMSMFLVGRHTRAEEESGRDELLRAGVVGRTATLTTTTLVATTANVLVGLAVTGSLVGYGLAVSGAVALGLGLALTGLAFTGLALLIAQLTSSTRAMYGLVGAVLGVSYGLRAIGDITGGTLSWFSPIGWYQGMRAYAGERWFPTLLLLALAVASLAAAYAVFGRRDFGAGIWATRPGNARATPRLATSSGLAWQLQRGPLVGWTFGMAVGGLAYGTVGDQADTLIGDSQLSQDLFALGGLDLVDAFYAVAALMLVLIGACFTISSVLRPRHEEDDGRVEPLLATALPRQRWLWHHALITVTGTVLVLGAGGVGLGVGYALVTGDWSAVGRLTGAVLALLPGALLLGGVARLLYGWVPRMATAAWLVLVFCWVVMVFGTVLQFPSWLVNISPFSWLAAVPAEPMRWTPFLVVLGLAILASAVGFAGFRRRDVH